MYLRERQDGSILELPDVVGIRGHAREQDLDLRQMSPLHIQELGDDFDRLRRRLAQIALVRRAGQTDVRPVELGRPDAVGPRGRRHEKRGHRRQIGQNAEGATPGVRIRVVRMRVRMKGAVLAQVIVGEPRGRAEPRHDIDW